MKRYSSGMYVRLAFAVAAHLEPEILVIDEVLAVGDAEFQKKCLGKMHEVSSSLGRTVLFVSHNMPAVGALCGRTFLLERGRLLNRVRRIAFYEATMSVTREGRTRTSGWLRQRFAGADYRTEEAWMTCETTKT